MGINFLKAYLLFLVMLSLLSLNCYANSSVTVDLEVASFNSGNYTLAAQLGNELVSLNPKDFKARYYYAAALMKLNRFDDAREQYAECYRTTNDPTMKSYCYRALQVRRTNLSSPSAVSTSLNHSSSGPLAAIDTDPALAARKLQIMSDAAKEIEFHRKQAQDSIQRAKERSHEQMMGIPPYFERPLSIISAGSLRTEMAHVENPDYKPAYDRSQKELADVIGVINRDLTRRDAEITAECRRKIEFYDQVPTAFRSQQRPGTSQIQMTPQNTSGYLRNFVNYDGSTPVSLKARQSVILPTSKAAFNSHLNQKRP